MRSEGGFAEVLVRSVIAKEECHIEGMVANFTLPPEQRLKVFLQSAILMENASWHMLQLHKVQLY